MNMLDGYIKTKLGIIKQLNPSPYNYGFEYSSKYEKLGPLGLQMAHLRFGFLRGVIGNKTINSLLDVGYGCGDFLKVAVSSIPVCHGTDLDEAYNVPTGCNFVSELDSQHYDVITFFDSLEHMPENEFVKDLDCNYICISLPWCHYFSDDWFDTWKHRRPDEHIWHYNDESLSSYMNAMGYNTLLMSNIEDTIRKGVDSHPNILTGIFEKRKYGNNNSKGVFK